MAWTEQNLAIAASKRLRMDGESLLTLQSFIPNALNNLARKVANDDYQRRYLMSAPLTTTASVTSDGNFRYYAELSTLISTPQIMLDVLQYGTIFWVPALKTWTTSDVSGNRIYIANHGYQTGMPTLLSTTNALPAPLAINTTYYVVVISKNLISFATSLANALAGTVVTLTDTGAGIGTSTPQVEYASQWFGSPTQGLLDASIPYPYPYIWLEGTLLYTNKQNGTFRFNVPFVPALENLPVALESDLVDALVHLAITQGFEPITEAQK